MSWECACGIENGDRSETCGGCGWTREQASKYKADNAIPETQHAKQKETDFIYWPTITDEASAKRAARLGAGFCIFSAIMTLILGVFRYGYVKIDDDVAGAYIFAFIFLILGIGIYRMWRSAAVIATAMYCIDKIYEFIQTDGKHFLRLLLILIFINAVRGTFLYNRYMNESKQVTPNAPIGPK